MLTLEKYRDATTRYRCPRCGERRCFSRYVDETGQYLADDCGRCDREVKCGYHLKPADIRARDSGSGGSFHREQSLRRAVGSRTPKPEQPDYLENRHLIDTLGHYDQNQFVAGLLTLFPNQVDDVWAALREYHVGTYVDPYGAYTCFPYLDGESRVCRGKLIRYHSTTLKRLHGVFDTAELAKKVGSKSFTYAQVFFGEHLAAKNPTLPIGIVEAEKTAILASICRGVFPEMVWLASFSKSWLTADRLARIGRGRKVVLFPDADAFMRWSKVAEECRKNGMDTWVSTLIETRGTVGEKARGFDLADYLIRDQKVLNAEINGSLEDLRIDQEEAAAVREEGCGLYRDVPL